MTAREAMESLRKADPILLWGLGLAAAVFLYTVLNLTARSLWWDELFTLSIAEPTTPHADAVNQIRGDVHLPLYFYSARLWLQLWNTSSEFALRAYNLVPYAFAACMAFSALRQRMIAKPVALWLVVFCTSFGVFWYLQEARMYAMMIAQSLCGCLIVLSYDKRKLQPITPGYVAVLIVTFVVLPLSHWFTLGFAGCLLIGLSLWAFIEQRMKFVFLFVGLGVVLAALGGAWILFNSQSTIGAVDGYGGWIYGGSLTLWGLRHATVDVLLFTLTLNPVLILAAGLGIWRIVRSPRQNVGPLILLASSVFLGAAILAVSLISPMYQSRNFMWLIAPLALFAAIGLQFVFTRMNLSRARQVVAMLVIGAISLAIAPFAGRVSALELDQWRAAGRLVASTPGCETADIRATAFWLDPPRSDLDYRFSQRIFGYYAGGPERMKLVLKREKLAVDPNAACPVVLWIVEHESKVMQTASEVLGPSVDQLEAHIFEGHTVFLRPQAEHASSR